MQQIAPLGLDCRRVEQLLAIAKLATRVDSRMDLISARLLDYPYRIKLIGSKDSPEVFTAAMDGFDCVTFMETVLALALTHNTNDFSNVLQRLRYARGQVRWNSRNHYMVLWIRENTRSGWIQHRPSLHGAVRRKRLLNVVHGFASHHATVACIPKGLLLRQTERIRTGDLVFFVSIRKNLDVFHCGILINNGNGLRLRHASLSRGHVLEESLADFLKAHRMAGVIVKRPRVFPWR